MFQKHNLVLALERSLQRAVVGDIITCSLVCTRHRPSASIYYQRINQRQNDCRLLVYELRSETMIALPTIIISYLNWWSRSSGSIILERKRYSNIILFISLLLPIAVEEWYCVCEQIWNEQSRPLLYCRSELWMYLFTSNWRSASFVLYWCELVFYVLCTDLGNYVKLYYPLAYNRLFILMWLELFERVYVFWVHVF